MLKKEKRKVQQEGQDQGINPYSTPQALGKAVAKVKPYLPKSARKRKAVVEKLVSSTGIHLPKKGKKEFGGNLHLNPEVKQKVYLFYVQDSISRQSPGKRDFVVSWKTGKKEHLQKRHLLFSLREAHALFLKENPEVKIGLSKFSSLRPLNVLLSSGIPRNVCLCQYHESIKLICDCLKKEIAKFPNYSGDFVEKFVCSSDSEACMFGRCAKCLDWLKTITEEVDLEGPATRYEWKRVETVSPTASKKDSKTMKFVKKVKISKEGTIGDAVESLQGKLPSFLAHVFIKRQQSKFFEERLAKLGLSEAVIQVDFAENYTCKYQDEPQSAHWNQEQVTLFTVAIWTKEAAGVDNVCESHVIVSDEMMHDKKAVAVFMFHVVGLILSFA